MAESNAGYQPIHRPRPRTRTDRTRHSRPTEKLMGMQDPSQVVGEEVRIDPQGPNSLLFRVFGAQTLQLFGIKVQTTFEISADTNPEE